MCDTCGMDGQQEQPHIVEDNLSPEQRKQIQTYVAQRLDLKNPNGDTVSNLVAVSRIRQASDEAFLRINSLVSESTKNGGKVDSFEHELALALHAEAASLGEKYSTMDREEVLSQTPSQGVAEVNSTTQSASAEVPTPTTPTLDSTQIEVQSVPEAMGPQITADPTPLATVGEAMSANPTIENQQNELGALNQPMGANQPDLQAQIGQAMQNSQPSEIPQPFPAE